MLSGIMKTVLKMGLLMRQKKKQRNSKLYFYKTVENNFCEQYKKLIQGQY